MNVTKQRPRRRTAPVMVLTVIGRISADSGEVSEESARLSAGRAARLLAHARAGGSVRVRSVLRDELERYQPFESADEFVGDDAAERLMQIFAALGV